ncbi:MAG TPA: AAA family ATPase [Candidatus Limnocylindrales bacterium]
MARPAVVCSLPAGELDHVARGLTDAGFPIFRAADAAELGGIVRERRDVGLAIIDGETDFDAAIEMYEHLHGGERVIPTLMVVSPRAFDQFVVQQRADDTTEYFTRPYDVDALRWRVEAMLIRAQTFDDGSGPILTMPDIDGDALARRALIVAVFNPKGGVGKTTISTNLAATLQMHRGQQVLLIDADTVTGHIANSLGLDQIETVADAWEEDAALPRGLAGVASQHSSGMRVAVLAANPLQTEHIDPVRLADHLSGSKLGFDVLVADLHPDFGPLNRAIFARCDRILMPVTPDVPALNAAVKFLELAESDLGVRDRISLLINRANSGIAVADVERTVGMRAFATIRSGGPLFVRAANEGVTVIEKFPKEKVTDDFLQLADRLLDRESPVVAGSAERSLRGLFGRAQAEVVRA